jgi:hypothetical protein
MDHVASYITITIFLVVAIGVSFSFIRRHKSLASESRMKRMMMSCGIDERTARYADHILKLDMKDVRYHCRRCRDTGLCDRWLAGEAVAGNGFCPNLLKFKTAAARKAQAGHSLS